jgi:mRNA interferase HigB
MRVIAKKTLKEYFEKNAESKQTLLIWFKEVNNGKWKNHNEMKETFSSLSIIPNERIVFNIKGNKYRIVAKVNYDYQIIWIRFVGTHAEYDKIDATKI